jgi:hypothetical protein
MTTKGKIKVVWSEAKVKKLIQHYGIQGFRNWMNGVVYLHYKDVHVATDDGYVIPIDEYLKRVEEKAKRFSN